MWCCIFFLFIYVWKVFFSSVILLCINTNSSFCILLWVQILLTYCKFKILLCILIFSIFMSWNFSSQSSFYFSTFYLVLWFFSMRILFSFIFQCIFFHCKCNSCLTNHIIIFCLQSNLFHVQFFSQSSYNLACLLLVTNFFKWIQS